MTGLINVHTHILPGVDDGADDLEEALKMLELEYQDGVRTIFATPHYRKGMFECFGNQITKQYELVKKEASKRWKDLQIILGCEFHANMDMVNLLYENSQFAIVNSRCVLTEFSELSELSFIQERCYTLLSSGYDPIIAHAERYHALYNKFDVIEQLTDMGVYIQLNARRIMGKDGFGMKRFCKKMMKKDLLHFVGDDAHNMEDRKPAMGKCAEYIEKVMGADYAKKVLMDNPKNLIIESR